MNTKELNALDFLTDRSAPAAAGFYDPKKMNGHGVKPRFQDLLAEPVESASDTGIGAMSAFCGAMLPLCGERERGGPVAWVKRTLRAWLDDRADRKRLRHYMSPQAQVARLDAQLKMRTEQVEVLKRKVAAMNDEKSKRPRNSLMQSMDDDSIIDLMAEAAAKSVMVECAEEEMERLRAEIETLTAERNRHRNRSEHFEDRCKVLAEENAALREQVATLSEQVRLAVAGEG